MIATPELNAGVPIAKGRSLRSAWKFVQADDPTLVATWLEAREAYDRAEPAYQARAARFQRDRNIPRRRPMSPEAKALDIAAGEVKVRIEEMLVSGAVVYAGFRGGELDSDPIVIPIELLGHRRPRGPRVTVEGVVFYRVCLYRADALRGPGRPTGRTKAPRDADDRLRVWLAEVDHAAKTIPAITAELTAAHPEILSWWALSTATKRVAAALPVRANDFRP